MLIKLKFINLFDYNFILSAKILTHSLQISRKMSFALIHPGNLMKAVVSIVTTYCLAAIFTATGLGADQGSESKETWMAHPQFEQFKVRVIGVLPMDNMSLEPDGVCGISNR